MKQQAAAGVQPRPIGGEATFRSLLRRLRSYAGAFRSLETRLLLVLLAVALLVQVVYYLRIQEISPPYGLTTEHYYSPLAINLLHYGIYGSGEYPDIQRTTKRPPFYSVVLVGVYGLFGKDERYGLVLNNILIWLTIIVAYLIGRTLGPGIGLIAAVLYALDPIGLVNANTIGAGALEGLLLALFFLVTLRSFTSSVTLRRSLLSSLLLGLATFTRATTLYFGVPLVLAFFIAHRWLIRRVSLPRLIVLILALFSIQALIVGAWMTRNNDVSGNSDFAGMTSIHLYRYYVPLVIAREEGIRFEEARARLADELASDQEYLSIERNGDSQRYVVRKSIGLIIENPISAALVILEQIPVVFLNYPQSAASIFLNEERRESVGALLSERVRSKTSRMDLSGYGDIFRKYVDNGLGLLLVHAIFYKLFYVAFMLAGAIGVMMLLWRHETRPQGIFYFVMISYLVLIYSVWPSGRLRMGILPIYSAAAAYGVIWLSSIVRREAWRLRLTPLRVALAARLTPPRR